MGKTEPKSVYLVWEHLRFSTCSISIILATCLKQPHSWTARLLTWSRNKGKSATKIHHQKKGEGFSVAKPTELIDSMAGLSAEKEECPSCRPLSGFHPIFFSSRIHKSETAAWTWKQHFWNHGLYLFQFQGQKWPIISDFNLSGRKKNKKCEKKSLQQQVWSFWIWQFPINQVKRFKIETFVENQSTRQGHVPTHVNSMSFLHCPPSGPIFGCLANDTMPLCSLAPCTPRLQWKLVSRSTKLGFSLQTLVNGWLPAMLPWVPTNKPSCGSNMLSYGKSTAHF